MPETRFPTTILVATDGSEPGRHAIDLAGELATATGSKLHLLNVTLISRYIYPDILSDAQMARIQAEADKRLALEVSYAKTKGIEPAATHVRLGRSDVEVLTLAEELNAGLIVIGNRTGETIERILLGNDAESIVRHAHCPVLVVR